MDNNKSFTDALMDSGFDTGVEYTGDLAKDFIDDIKQAFLEAIEGPKDWTQGGSSTVTQIYQRLSIYLLVKTGFLDMGSGTTGRTLTPASFSPRLMYFLGGSRV